MVVFLINSRKCHNFLNPLLIRAKRQGLACWANCSMKPWQIVFLICPKNNGISENRIFIMCRNWNLFLRKFIYAVKPVCNIIKKRKRKISHFRQVYVQFVYVLLQMNDIGFSCLLQLLWANADHSHFLPDSL
jgi:hypothetical protein